MFKVFQVTASYQKLGLISCIFYQCSPEIKEKLYNHLVRSKLEYCCTVRDPNQIYLKQSTERVQENSRIALVHSFDNYDQAMTDLKWSRLPNSKQWYEEHCLEFARLHDCREYHKNIMWYKIYHEIVESLTRSL